MKILMMMLSMSCMCFAKLRGNDGGGGILLSAEFATAGRSALEIMAKGDPEINMRQVFLQIADVKVIPIDRLCYQEPVYSKEFCQDAHYDKLNNVILFVYQRWDSFSCTEKLVLATHEYLRAAGLENEDYKYSGRFLSNRLTPCIEKVGLTPNEQMNCSRLNDRVQVDTLNLCRRLKFFKNQRSQD